MKHSIAGAALLKLRRTTPDPVATPTPDDSKLSGPGLLEQEPDLAKEAGEYTRAASGWAAGGQPSGE